jgi:hypothetical protein
VPRRIIRSHRDTRARHLIRASGPISTRADRVVAARRAIATNAADDRDAAAIPTRALWNATTGPVSNARLVGIRATTR